MERKGAKSYLKRLNYELNDFILKVQKQNPWVHKWINVKSKWTSSQRYIVLISFYELQLFNKSLRKKALPTNKRNNIKINDDEQHWYNWLKDCKQHPVSTYLSKKYKKNQQILVKRRIKTMKRTRKHYYGNINVGVMKKEDLLYFAKEHNVEIPKAMTHKKKIMPHVLKVLQDRKVNDWESNQICYNTL